MCLELTISSYSSKSLSYFSTSLSLTQCCWTVSPWKSKEEGQLRETSGERTRYLWKNLSSTIWGVSFRGSHQGTLLASRYPVVLLLLPCNSAPGCLPPAYSQKGSSSPACTEETPELTQSWLCRAEQSWNKTAVGIPQFHKCWRPGKLWIQTLLRIKSSGTNSTSGNTSPGARYKDSMRIRTNLLPGYQEVT